MQDEQILRFEAPETRRAIAEAKEEAIYQTTSSIDGRERTVGIRKVGKYPIYVLVSLAKEDYLKDWRGDLRNHVIFLLLLALIGSLFSIALGRSWRNRALAVEKIMLKDLALQRSLDALSVSEERFRTLTEGLPQMSWVKDADGRVQYLSRQWSDFTGIPLAALLNNEGWRECVHPDDRCHIDAAWAKALETGVEYHSQARIRRHDGVWRTFENNALPQRNAKGEIVGWVGSAAPQKRLSRPINWARLPARRIICSASLTIFWIFRKLKPASLFWRTRILNWSRSLRGSAPWWQRRSGKKVWNW